jgi:hypothetical protein
MMPLPRLCDALESAVKSQFVAALADEPDTSAEFVARLLARISPPNWTLEWALPGWLGEVLGLDESAVADLTLANVFGLAYVKLQDDLMDGETDADDRSVAVLLSSVLYRKWLLIYAGRFAAGSPFWGYFERYMAQWVAATQVSHGSPAKSFHDYEDADWRSLGHRGAPLKICAAAVCVLTQRKAVLARLEQALDYLLTGAVLFDHACDWRADLAAGRHNTFVAYTSGWPQTPDYLEVNRRMVVQELLVGKWGQAYFDLLGREILAAWAIVHTDGFAAFARYLKWLHRETISYRKAVTAAGRDQLHQALKPLFTAAEARVSV